jgi:hypothetical protein
MSRGVLACQARPFPGHSLKTTVSRPNKGSIIIMAKKAKKTKKTKRLKSAVVINLHTAETMNVDIPDIVLSRADEIIV